MANIKSQKKRILTNEKSRQRNVAVRSRVKTIVKRADESIVAKDAEKAKAELITAISEIDRACTKGVIHSNQAARRKSSLQRRYNQMQTENA
jgi:small subunit ribosomal protein S20